MGAPRAKALCHCFGGALDFQSGRWDEAEIALRQAIDLYRLVGSASGESLSLQRLGVLLTARGDLDRARDIMNDAIVVAERAAMRSHCLTRLHASMTRNRLAARDLEGARASLEEGLHTARRHGHCVTCNALLLPEAVRVEVALGRIDEADEHATQLEHIAGNFDSKVWTAMAAHARARVLAARERGDEAKAAFALASSAFIEVGQAYEAARCQLGLSALCRQCGDEERADALAVEADRALRALGATALEA